MLNTPELTELRRANPVSLDDARRVADTLDLRARVVSLRNEQLTPRAARRPARRRTLLVALTAVAVLAAILVATPAWALIRDVLQFWDQPTAPQSVQVEFSSLNLGAPPGMSPEAASGDTREIGRFTFGGLTRTLWVAPAKNGGFCVLWLPRGGGGCSTAGLPLGTGAMLVLPHAASEPARTPFTPSQVRMLMRKGVPAWITGDAISPTVNDVVIRFSDGHAVRPRIVWVSAPINAGFFAYDVPNDEQSSRVHVTAVDAYDREGSLVKSQTFTESPGG
jgi:hypothetical protein